MAKDQKFKGYDMGGRIRRAREAKGFSIKKLATFCNISPATFSHIETGTANITQSQLEKLAQLLETTDLYLLTGSDVTETQAQGVSPAPVKSQEATAEAQKNILPQIGSIDVSNTDFTLTLKQELHNDVAYIANGRGETIEDTMQELLDTVTVTIREWIDTSLKPLKEKLIESKTMDIEAILAGLSQEDIQKVLSKIQQ